MWVLLGEMFPNRLRAAALAVSGATNWAANCGHCDFSAAVEVIGLARSSTLHTGCNYFVIFVWTAVGDEGKLLFLIKDEQIPHRNSDSRFQMNQKENYEPNKTKLHRSAINLLKPTIPAGLHPLSPGLRGTSYPGWASNVTTKGCAQFSRLDGSCHNAPLPLPRLVYALILFCCVATQPFPPRHR
jgi:hypothetical protein